MSAYSRTDEQQVYILSLQQITGRYDELEPLTLGLALGYTRSMDMASVWPQEGCHVES